jgi:hypothetical protein
MQKLRLKKWQDHFWNLRSLEGVLLFREVTFPTNLIASKSESEYEKVSHGSSKSFETQVYPFKFFMKIRVQKSNKNISRALLGNMNSWTSMINFVATFPTLIFIYKRVLLQYYWKFCLNVFSLFSLGILFSVINNCADI